MRTAASVNTFPGFITLYSEGKDEAEEEERAKPCPRLEKGDELKLLGLFPEQRFTQPPPRYTEATLVKTLEQNGIGRPSTYAPIISTIQDRDYVGKKKGKFFPEELGMVVNDLLVEHFPRLFNVGFTARMEEDLDEISRGERDWTGAVKEFYPYFEKTLKKASENMVRIKEADEPTEEICPKCGKPMVIKTGRFGKFLACTGFPKCKTVESPDKKTDTDKEKTQPKEAGESTDEVCPKCGKPMVIKTGRFGKFLACTGFPKCKNTRSLKTKAKKDE